MKLLLIEDNSTIASQLVTFFEGLGWAVDYAAAGRQGVELARGAVFDVLVLDLNLPDMDGLEVCQTLKAELDYNLPVLMLTARDAFADKASGYGQGADDYVTKPCDLRELKLRCEALGRRHQLHKTSEIRLGDLTLATKSQEAWREDVPLKLTQIGFRILLELAGAYPGAVTRSQLMHSLWGDDPPDSDALRSHIYSLRNALDKPFAKPMLKTLPNVGYRLVCDET
ncbi:response regulator transcription factor [Halioglobus maricola]|uniref:Response regulator transcription factor n=1 Tax=Halioglobus maricola TaxID=2601894 RepID=A0A5P9NH58_9GAMM|nr:response regulator transcription factor [Halioglobus maricola]QFU75112.1 response regulator transcription factor [Halioglobus maricola]